MYNKKVTVYSSSSYYSSSSFSFFSSSSRLFYVTRAETVFSVLWLIFLLSSSRSVQCTDTIQGKVRIVNTPTLTPTTATTNNATTSIINTITTQLQPSTTAEDGDKKEEEEDEVRQRGGGEEEEEGGGGGGGGGGGDGPTTPVPIIHHTRNSADRNFNSDHHPDPRTPHRPLPSTVEVDLRLGGRKVHLQLSRDREFETSRLPVYVVSIDEKGILQSNRAKLNDTEFAVYQDVRNEGAFGVYREKDENGKARYKLAGLVHSEGYVYKVQSPERHTSSYPRPPSSPPPQRHRRAALDDGNVKDSPTSTDPNGADGDRDGDGDIEGEVWEQFQVEVFPDQMVQGVDYVRASPTHAIRKLRITADSPPLVLPSASPFSTTTFTPLHPSRHQPLKNDDLDVGDNSNNKINISSRNNSSNPNNNSTRGSSSSSDNNNSNNNNSKNDSSITSNYKIDNSSSNTFNGDNDNSDNVRDDNIRDKTPERRRRMKRRRIGKRQAKQDLYVDVLALVDYGAFATYYNQTSGDSVQQRTQKTMEFIRQYYAIVMNGVDLRYKTITSMSYRINVRLSSIYVLTTEQASQLTEKYRTPLDSGGRRKYTVNANKTLHALREWVSNADFLPAYDHVMLFSGYDLTGDNGNTGITGLAFTGTACDMEGTATSVVEDIWRLQCVFTAAHELGHGLSAKHDGTQNQCDSSERYIMADRAYLQTPRNKLNPWRFSPCSIAYFSDFIHNSMQTARGLQCLTGILPVEANLPNVTSLLPGQMSGPDEQCRQALGPGSRLCRELKTSGDICTDFFCLDPMSPTNCIKLMAARGTSCGNRKLCKSGTCVYDIKAPAVPDSCVHGDQPGVAIEGMECAAFLSRYTGYCYQRVVWIRCCGSCLKHSKPVSDCEFGDNFTDCSRHICPVANEPYLKGCCGTCNYGTTPQLTNLPPASQSCNNDSVFTVNHMTCSDIVAQKHYVCYDVSVYRQCCASCQAVQSGIAGCEYGDRDPDRCLKEIHAVVYGSGGSMDEVCESLHDVCCKTCSKNSSSSLARLANLGGMGTGKSWVAAVVMTLAFYAMVLDVLE